MMKRFDALTSEVKGSYLLEASAGTGKTFAIEHIVSRLVEGGMELGRILVVTFTRAAARELRQRIFARLRGKDLDGAKITTIHGFCADLLRESGRDIEIDLAAVAERRRQVIRDTLAHPPCLPTQLERILRFTGGDPVDAIDRELERGKPIEGPDFGAMPEVEPEKLEEDLHQYARRYTGLVDRQKELKPELVEAARKGQAAPIVAAIGKVRANAPEISLHYPDLVALLDPLAILAHMAAACQQKWKQVMCEEELLTYDALLEQALESSLGEFDVIIVDEFQDTDSVQWQLFEKYIAAGSNFVAVGDPKQSIYAFRNADLRVYHKAATTIPVHYALDVNYRSRPSLVEALNDLLDAPPVEAGVQEDNELSRDPLIFFGGGNEKEQLAFIAGEIEPPYDRFAVLVKDRYQAARAHAFFQECGIPARASRGLALEDSPAYCDLRDLALALENPADQSRLKLVLSSPLFGWNEAQLAELDKRSVGIATQIERLQRKLKEEGLASCVAELAQNVTDPDYLDQLYAVAALFAGERGPLPRIDGQVYPGGGRDAVHLLTTFASKGLEFGVVFGLGLASSPPRAGRQLISCDGKLRASLTEQEQIERQTEADAEKLRLLYVACTRAIDRLYLPAVGGRSSPIALLLQGREVAVREARPIAVSPQKGWRLQPRLQAIQRTKRRIHSFTSLVDVDPEHLQPPANFSAEEKTPHTLPAGAETGILLHQLLEWRTSDVSGSRFAPWQQVVDEMLHNAWNTPLADFCLEDVEKVSAEMEFCFSLPEAATFSGQQVAPGMVKGVIDLLFEHEGRAYLLDWKSNWLGPDLSFYTPERLHMAMEQHGYFLQLELYLQALGRYLCSVDRQPLAEKLGGVFYIFLRGLDGTGETGVFFQPC